ncbi:MAG: aldo/keto reductase [Synergistales bacterium]|nr:aldo/keto reductase [Synergistales bacterium]
MLYRKMPRSGDRLSILGFGCMRLSLKNGEIDEERAIRQIRSAIDGGVNYIDTAAPYHNGQSEIVVGKALSEGYRDRVKLATKLSWWMVEEDEGLSGFLEHQMEKLRTDHLDYYLLHAMTGEGWEQVKKIGALEFLEEARKDGSIGNAGFSFHGTPGLFREILDSFDWDFCQIQYNYLDENFQAGTEGLKYAYARGLGVIVMEPLRGGSLARTVPPSVEALWNKAEIKRTPAEWGLRWVWDHPEVTVVLSGMNEETHLEENLRIANEGYPKSLSQMELELINQAAEEYRRLTKVHCTGCRYCMPCPAGVDIPMCFEFYNRYHLLGQEDPKRQYYYWLGGVIGEKAHASLCVNCGRCLELCPQNLEIPQLLKGVVKDLEGPEFEKK